MKDSTYSVDENSGVVEVCADLLIGELEGVDAVVQLTTQSGTASEPGERLVMSLVAFVVAGFNPCSLPLPPSLCPAADDYVSLDVELTFPSMAGSDCTTHCTTQCVTITITDDSITEPEETFSVILVPVSDFVTVREITTSSVVIDDDDGESRW